VKVAVVGGGSWGTALALVLAKNNHEVSLWCFKEEEADSIISNRENTRYLPNIKIPQSIKVTCNISEAICNASIIVLVVPSFSIRENMMNMLPFLEEGQAIVSASKGLEEGTLLRLSEVIEEVAPMCKVGVLSGPTHAEEVAKEMPTACVASSKDAVLAKTIQEIFMTPYFRIYTNEDIIGVEVGGALKNVIALAGGIIDGVGYGDNAKAALMTRGMKEIARLGVYMGADIKTFSGLTGIGDLIVTCTSMHSRNRRGGILLGQGKSLEEMLKEIGMVVEGVNTVKAAYELSLKYQVEMPLIEEINNILMHNKPAEKAVEALMTRKKTDEYIHESYIF